MSWFCLAESALSDRAETAGEDVPVTPAASIFASGVRRASLSEGGRTVTASYAELSIPILKTLEASLAARYDHDSDFGSTTNPKVGLKSKPPPR